MQDIIMDIKDPKIEGDCGIEGWLKKIVVNSFQAGARGSVTTSSSDAGMSFGGSDLEPITLVKNVDPSSPKLFAHCSQGKEIKDMDIHILSTGSTANQPYLTYNLKGVLVAALTVSGAGEGLPQESVTLYARAIDILYKQRDETGNFTDNVIANFDMAKQAVS